MIRYARPADYPAIHQVESAAFSVEAAAAPGFAPIVCACAAGPDAASCRHVAATATTDIEGRGHRRPPMPTDLAANFTRCG